MMELGEHPFIQEIPEDSSMVKKQFLHTFFLFLNYISNIACLLFVIAAQPAENFSQ